MLGTERGRCCCHCRRWLEVHVTTGTRLFGPGRATATRGVSVHTSTLATCHFPTARREGKVGEDGGRLRKGFGRTKIRSRKEMIGIMDIRRTKSKPEQKNRRRESRINEIDVDGK